MYRILTCLLLPLSVGAIDRKALEKKAATGNAEAQYQLAEALFWGSGGKQDLMQAVNWAGLSAKQGNAKGEYRLGVQLVLGQGTETSNENDKKGFEWLEKASVGLQKLANQGDHDAQHKLALLYLSGLIKGEEDNPYSIDEKKAVDLIGKAANGGNVSSQFRFSLIHRIGLSGKLSNEKSAEWLRKAADNGSAYAAYGLWMRFRLTQGKLVKLEEAEPYLKSAAKQSLATAQLQYGIALFEGLLKEVDQEAGIEWVKKAAEQGLAPAQLLLGQTLAGDRILDQDLKSSFFWLTLASNGQSGKVRADARKFLTRIHSHIAPADRLDLQQRAKKFKPKESTATRSFHLGLEGAGSDITVPMRIDLLTALAPKGNVAAMVTLGEVHRRSGKIQESLEWFKMAAKKDDIHACAILAKILITGNHGEREPDLSAGINWLKTAAELGDVPSMSGLAEYIFKGEVKGVKPEEGVKWVIKAADNGYAPAQTSLGGMYVIGDLIEQDYLRAKEWFLKATRQNYPRAQSFLGQYYREGRGMEKPDFIEAIKWYRLAARQGDGPAQFALGMMHMDGMGVNKDFREAYKWLEVSQRHGMGGGGARLAGCAKELTPVEIRRAVAEAKQFRAQNYYHPDGTAGEETEPSGQSDIETLQIKANRGDADAQFQLAQRYAAGDGVGLDPVQAYKWFVLAQNSGHDKAASGRGKLVEAKRIKLQQIIAARKLAKDFRPKDD